MCIVHQDGKTALMHASDEGHKDVVQLLLNYAAGVDIKSNVSIIYTIDCMYLFIYESMYESMNGDICVCMTSIYTCVRMYLRIHEYIYTYLCMYEYS